MIITIKGTSGSGKTTIVKDLMKLYDSIGKVYVEGRKQPLGYLCFKENGKTLAVIGHYETACGGCDTIKIQEHIFELVRKAHAENYDVIFEGLLVGGEFNRNLQLHTDKLPFKVIELNTTLEECIVSINTRRNQKWLQRCAEIEEYNKNNKKQKQLPEKPKDIDPSNTAAKFNCVKKVVNNLKNNGAETHTLSREDAFNFIRSTFNV